MAVTAPPPPPPLCIACQHHGALRSDGDVTHICNRSSVIDVVSGSMLARVCNTERTLAGADLCGPQGQFFVAIAP